MKNYCLLVFIMILTSCGHAGKDKLFEQGVSSELARYRKGLLQQVRYELTFTIPDNPDEEIPGEAKLSFNLRRTGQKPLLIDFNVPDEYLKEVAVNGEAVMAEHENGHIIIPRRHLKKGGNMVYLKYRTGELSLNRNPDFMYTLLVPDRASTAFPCFDQPDIKARFLLTLNLPGEYEAMSNSPVASDTIIGGTRTLVFSEGEPISTYLFAFTAGRFQKIETEIGGISMEMLHREPSKEIVERNTDAIFSLHYNSIRWMEEYTGIEYPFSKFGFALIPSFQYGGMEHPGAIFYRASSLLLEESPGMNEKLSRASLIAHETSHIWFGDLVTMKWFDDVWLKEVFAGYMADKIVNPDFPETNHELRFLLSRYPAAYGVDRTSGANPVIQYLDNLKNAGSLYGGIIYNKAPIAMKHLEQMTGDSILRESLKIYLEKYSYDNAEWDDLIKIIEDVSGMSLEAWSNAWMREPGMPEIETIITGADDGIRIMFEEKDPFGKGRHWPQTVKTLVRTAESTVSAVLTPGDESSFIRSGADPVYIIPDTTGVAYGFFRYDSITLQYLSNNAESFHNETLRGVIWLNLNENLINGNIEPDKMYSAVLKATMNEENEVLRNYLNGRLSSVYWNYFDEAGRIFYSGMTEKLIWEKVQNSTDPSIRRLWFNLFRNIAISADGLSKLMMVWESGKISGIQTLSEDELCSLAMVLSLKRHPDADEIISRQLAAIKNPDRKLRFEFVMPSVSSEENVRDKFFASLADAGNREREPWVLEAIGNMHHPVNASTSTKYIRKSLEMLEEIKYTGDIFFPGSWIGTTLSGHRSERAWKIVSDFLKEYPDYPEDLRMKIIQASDHLYRQHVKEDGL